MNGSLLRRPNSPFFPHSLYPRHRFLQLVKWRHIFNNSPSVWCASGILSFRSNRRLFSHENWQQMLGIFSHGACMHTLLSSAQLSTDLARQKGAKYRCMCWSDHSVSLLFYFKVWTQKLLSNKKNIYNFQWEKESFAFKEVVHSFSRSHGKKQFVL